MYTEENDFDYNDYIDDIEETNSNKSNRPFLDWKFILKVILIIVLVCLIIFLVYKIKNKNLEKGKIKEDTEIKSDGLAINDNLNLVRDAAYSYFFEKNNLPLNVGDSKTITIKELVGENFLISIKDKNGIECGYNTSNATITKNANDYELKVTLNCLNDNLEKTFYYDLEGKCLTCNGESYTSSVEEIKPADESKSEEESQTPSEKEKDDTTRYVCDNTYSEWTTTRRTGTNLEEDTRVLVKGYKTETTYGEWSAPTTNEILGSGNLEVQSFNETTENIIETCSGESTTKPASKEGRIITSRKVTESTNKKVCTGGETYTKTLTKWDNTAIKCVSYGIGNVVCLHSKSSFVGATFSWISPPG